MKKILAAVALAVLVASPLFAFSQKEEAEPAGRVVSQVPAHDVRLVKKSFVDPEDQEKARPSSPPGQSRTPPGQERTPPGQEKNDGGEASGVLGAPGSGEKYAIVVGICNYPGEENDICWSDGDSLNMYNALLGYGYTEENIYLFRDMVGNGEPFYDPDGVTDGPATSKNIKDAITTVKEAAEKGDEVVFFFSGHGGDGMASDGDQEKKDEAIVVHNGSSMVFWWDGTLKQMFEGIATSRVIFVFDSCLAGGMDDVAASGRVVAMGTSENQPGYVYSKGIEGEEPGEGAFSHYFANEGLLQGLAENYDHDNDPETEDVTVEEAFFYAEEKVKADYKRQKPQIEDLFQDDLLLGYTE